MTTPREYPPVQLSLPRTYPPLTPEELDALLEEGYQVCAAEGAELAAELDGVSGDGLCDELDWPDEPKVIL